MGSTSKRRSPSQSSESSGDSVRSVSEPEPVKRSCRVKSKSKTESSDDEQDQVNVKDFLKWKSSTNEDLEKSKQKEEQIKILRGDIAEMSRKLNIEEKKNKDLQSQYLKVVSDHKIEVNKLKEELESKSSQLSNLESDTEASDLEKTELHHKIFLQSSELEDIKCKLL